MNNITMQNINQATTKRAESPTINSVWRCHTKRDVHTNPKPQRGVIINSK